MSDQIERLRTVVRELEHELQTMQDLDDQATEDLQAALQEILLVLQSRQQGAPSHVPPPVQADAEPTPDTPLEQLRRSAREFEGSHPTLSGILLRLIDGLGQMGI